MVPSEFRIAQQEFVRTSADPRFAPRTPCYRPVTYPMAEWGSIAFTTTIGQVVTISIAEAVTITTAGFMDFGRYLISLVRTKFVQADLIIELTADEKGMRWKPLSKRIFESIWRIAVSIQTRG